MNRLVQCVAVLTSALTLGSAPAISGVAEESQKPVVEHAQESVLDRPAGHALRSLMDVWTLAPGPYEMRCDDLLGACALPLLRSRSGAGAGVETTGMLARSEAAGPWAGATVAFKAELRAGQVSGAATLWILATDDAGRVLAFADTSGAALKGSTSFQSRVATLEVPHGAATLRFGVALKGTGAVFIREVQLKDVTEHPRVVSK